MKSLLGSPPPKVTMGSVFQETDVSHEIKKDVGEIRVTPGLCSEFSRMICGRSNLTRRAKLIKGSGARRPGSSSPVSGNERASETGTGSLDLTGHIHVNGAASSWEQYVLVPMVM